MIELIEKGVYYSLGKLLLKGEVENALSEIKGFDAKDVPITGVETRTSAPVRIMRTQEYTMLTDKNVYPGGEGAGYAGGIMSASVDGIKIALAILKKG